MFAHSSFANKMWSIYMLDLIFFFIAAEGVFWQKPCASYSACVKDICQRTIYWQNIYTFICFITIAEELPTYTCYHCSPCLDDHPTDEDLRENCKHCIVSLSYFFCIISQQMLAHHESYNSITLNLSVIIHLYRRSPFE